MELIRKPKGTKDIIGERCSKIHLYFKCNSKDV